MGMVEHIKTELKYAGYTPLDQEQEDGPNKWIQENLIEIGEVFSKQGHSGYSAAYCVNALNRLLRFSIMAPLQGTDDEWTEVSDGLLQNKRLSSVFKSNGVAYDIDYRAFTERLPDSGEIVGFSNYLCREKITFPYIPKDTPEVVHRPSLKYFWLWLKYKLGVNKAMWR